MLLLCHHLSSAGYKDVLISQGDVRPLGVASMVRLNSYALLTLCFNPFKYEEQTALFKDPVRTAQ